MASVHSNKENVSHRGSRLSPKTPVLMSKRAGAPLAYQDENSLSIRAPLAGKANATRPAQELITPLRQSRVPLGGKDTNVHQTNGNGLATSRKQLISSFTNNGLNPKTPSAHNPSRKLRISPTPRAGFQKTPSSVLPAGSKVYQQQLELEEDLSKYDQEVEFIPPRQPLPAYKPIDHIEVDYEAVLRNAGVNPADTSPILLPRLHDLDSVDSMPDLPFDLDTTIHSSNSSSKHSTVSHSHAKPKKLSQFVVHRDYMSSTISAEAKRRPPISPRQTERFVSSSSYRLGYPTTSNRKQQKIPVSHFAKNKHLHSSDPPPTAIVADISDDDIDLKSLEFDLED